MTTTILNNDADFYAQALSERSRGTSNPTVKIGFMARALVQASLPHSKINKGDMFHRTNGLFTLSIISYWASLRQPPSPLNGMDHHQSR